MLRHHRRRSYWNLPRAARLRELLAAGNCAQNVEHSLPPGASLGQYRDVRSSVTLFCSSVSPPHRHLDVALLKRRPCRPGAGAAAGAIAAAALSVLDRQPRCRGISAAAAGGRPQNFERCTRNRKWSICHRRSYYIAIDPQSSIGLRHQSRPCGKRGDSIYLSALIGFCAPRQAVSAASCAATVLHRTQIDFRMRCPIGMDGVPGKQPVIALSGGCVARWSNMHLLVMVISGGRRRTARGRLPH